MTRAQEPAQNECKGVVDDDSLNLLGEALFLVLVMFRHLAPPARHRRHRYSQHDPGGDLGHDDVFESAPVAISESLISLCSNIFPRYIMLTLLDDVGAVHLRISESR